MPLTDLDRRLLSDLIAGESGSWKHFVDRFAGLVLQVIRHTAHAHSLKLSDDDVEDLCADVYAELVARDMAALRNFRGRCSFATYLAVIVRRIVVRRLTQHRYRQALGHVVAHQAAIDSAAGPSSSTRRVDNRDEAESLLNSLPDELREIARRHFLNGETYAEIARQLKRPINSIGPTLSRIRDRLRAQFGGEEMRMSK
ncbi:MAG: sigma-70 family RNA polymerase sigma factor [Planctomycetaceae bacterium]|nr:sigma-70 family RNA polymerase sigma factor [Planctomycetaceae bacterium]